MTQRFPRPVAFAAAALLLFAAVTAQAASKAAKGSKKPAAKAAAKSAGKGARGREAASRRDSRQSKRERAADSRRGRNDRNDRSARNDRRGSKRDRDDSRASAKDPRKMSRRERIAEARREAERRRREAAERARQLAIARAIAEARRRAADQALKDETAANILKDETTGEDLTVRRAALDALGDRAGSVVVMNPKTGQVYTVVNQEWALRRGFKPCSTIKLVTGLAGLSEHVIDPVQTVNIGTSSYALDLTESLAYSNNGYFQRVGGQVGFPKMMEYAHKLGLGEPTGINHPFESPGRLPVFKEGYAVNHMSSHGDDIEVTTIQLARMASAIANGGKLLVPHLPRTPQENVKFKTEVRRDVDIPKETLERMLPGMIGAVSYGTAKRSDPTMAIAGKTGTCTGQGSKLGLFTSFGPVYDPQLAVAVILRNSGVSGPRAAEVAGGVYRRLAQDARFAPRGARPNLANDMLAPRPHLDPRKAAAVSDEDSDDDADEATRATNDAFVVSEAGGAQSTQQPAVQKTARTVERPASAPTPANTNATAPAPMSNTTAAPAGGGAQRPRRVNDRP
ncbi:MAG TPA: penicillin-binding transpeptidase domain-containing protein [Pyrinomonadaceae bacterium]|nr:penicillin-binding transpeptidase domain-containing protein [Pyrinomonadaceae bacterium]